MITPRGIDFLGELKGQPDYEIMPLGIRDQIDWAIDKYAQQGMTENLQRKLRSILVQVQQQHAFLDARQAAELKDILRKWSVPKKHNEHRMVFLITTAVILALAIVVTLIAHVVRESNSGIPPAGGAQQVQQQQVPLTDNDLQSFQKDWAPFTQFSASDNNPQTHQPYLILLNNGFYYASQWKIPSSDEAWALDVNSDVSSVNVKGNYADITDNNRVPYVVGINQPFVIGSLPGYILRVDPTGNVYVMRTSHGTAIHTK